MQETWVWFLSREDPLEEGMATPSSILAWRILMGRGIWQATVQRMQRIRHYWVPKHKTVALQAPLSVGFPRQEYQNGLPFPSPLGLPNPGIQPTSPVSIALQADSLPLRNQGIPQVMWHAPPRHPPRKMQRWRTNPHLWQERVSPELFGARRTLQEMWPLGLVWKGQ